MKKAILDIAQKALSSVMILVVLSGITGFTIEEHSCLHCGLEYSIVFSDTNQKNADTCVKNSDCCTDSTDKGYDHLVLYGLENNKCCNYIYSDFLISDPVNITVIVYDIEAPLINSEIISIDKERITPAFFDINSIPLQVSGRDIIVSNSQFLS